MASHDIVLRRGRVIDPETGLDVNADVAIDGRTVAAVATEPLEGTLVIDVTGLVVAPGFIDVHSHAQTLAGRRLQACDGVTTALDLEAGPRRSAWRIHVSPGKARRFITAFPLRGQRSA